MQVIIFCGGKGTRLQPSTETLPKPMINVGDMPILEHIMKFYSHYGHKDFILCLGYMGEKIKEYFEKRTEWNITFVDTGENTNKAQRLKMVEKFIKNDTFFVTYGDGLSDINLAELLKFHKSHNGIATLTTVNPISQFGILNLDSTNKVTGFEEKPVLDCLINGGFFVFNRRIFDFIEKGDDLERDVFQKISGMGLLYGFRHNAFWVCMDTYQDNIKLNELWNNGNAKWAVWKMKI